jgi:hypothetical protein
MVNNRQVPSPSEKEFIVNIEEITTHTVKIQTAEERESDLEKNKEEGYVIYKGTSKNQWVLYHHAIEENVALSEEIRSVTLQSRQERRAELKDTGRCKSDYNMVKATQKTWILYDDKRISVLDPTKDIDELKYGKKIKEFQFDDEALVHQAIIDYLKTVAFKHHMMCEGMNKIHIAVVKIKDFFWNEAKGVLTPEEKKSAVIDKLFNPDTSEVNPFEEAIKNSCDSYSTKLVLSVISKQDKIIFRFQDDGQSSELPEFLSKGIKLDKKTQNEDIVEAFSIDRVDLKSIYKHERRVTTKRFDDSKLGGEGRGLRALVCKSTYGIDFYMQPNPLGGMVLECISSFSNERHKEVKSIDVASGPDNESIDPTLSLPTSLQLCIDGIESDEELASSSYARIWSGMGLGLQNLVSSPAISGAHLTLLSPESRTRLLVDTPSDTASSIASPNIAISPTPLSSPVHTLMCTDDSSGMPIVVSVAQNIGGRRLNFDGVDIGGSAGGNYSSPRSR